MQHGFGERGQLGGAHPAQQYGHKKRRHLIVGDRAACVTLYHELHFRRRELTVIALLANEVDGADRLGRRGSGGHERRHPAGSSSEAEDECMSFGAPSSTTGLGPDPVMYW